MQLPGSHHTDLIGHGKGFQLIVADQYGSDTVLLQHVADLAGNVFTQFHIQAGKRFIQQQYTRLGCHRPGNGHPLLLATRQAVREGLQQFADAQHIGQHTDAPLPFCRLDMLQAKGNIFLHCQVWEQRIVLKHHAHLTFFHGHQKTRLTDQLTGYTDAPTGHGFKPGNGAQQGGFATTTGTQQTADTPLIEAQVNVVHDRSVLQRYRYITQLKCVRHDQAWMQKWIN